MYSIPIAPDSPAACSRDTLGLPNAYFLAAGDDARGGAPRLRRDGLSLYPMSQADEGKALEPVPTPSARQSHERAMDRLFQQLLKVPSPKTLAHLVRFLGTWTGTDKFFMLAPVSYTHLTLPTID